jgi:hypothetical protein
MNHLLRRKSFDARTADRNALLFDLSILISVVVQKWKKQ